MRKIPSAGGLPVVPKKPTLLEQGGKTSGSLVMSPDITATLREETRGEGFGPLYEAPSILSRVPPGTPHVLELFTLTSRFLFVQIPSHLNCPNALCSGS